MLKYINFSLAPPPSAPLSQFATTDTLIPAGLANTTANDVYNRKFEYNPVSNTMYVLFSAAVVGYSADYLLRPAGYASMGGPQYWTEVDLSVSEGQGDLLAVFVGSDAFVYNTSTWGTLGYWLLLSTYTS